jgi:hypothetical protein
MRTKFVQFAALATLFVLGRAERVDAINPDPLCGQECGYFITCAEMEGEVCPFLETCDPIPTIGCSECTSWSIDNCFDDTETCDPPCQGESCGPPSGLKFFSGWCEGHID